MRNYIIKNDGILLNSIAQMNRFNINTCVLSVHTLVLVCAGILCMCVRARMHSHVRILSSVHVFWCSKTHPPGHMKEVVRTSAVKGSTILNGYT